MPKQQRWGKDLVMKIQSVTSFVLYQLMYHHAATLCQHCEMLCPCVLYIRAFAPFCFVFQQAPFDCVSCASLLSSPSRLFPLFDLFPPHVLASLACDVSQLQRKPRPIFMYCDALSSLARHTDMYFVRIL